MLTDKLDNDPGNLDEPVFLLTCGRTGSTLLQRLLNVHDDLHIWGEHGGGLSGLRTSHRMTTAPGVSTLIDQTPASARARVQASEPVVENGSWSIQWYNGFHNNDVTAACRVYMQHLFARGIKPTARRWGFKEIRYGPQDALFFRQLFTKAGFLVLVRDPVVVLRSQIEYFYLGNVVNGGQLDEKKIEAQSLHALKSIERVADTLDSDLADHCLEVRYEDLLADPVAVLSKISDYLEVTPFPHEKLETILGELKGAHTAGGEASKSIRAWVEAQTAGKTVVGDAIEAVRRRLRYQ